MEIVFSFVALLFCVLVIVLPIALVIALIRYLWRKGSK